MRIPAIAVMVVLSIGAWILAVTPQPLRGSDAGSEARTRCWWNSSHRKDAPVVPQQTVFSKSWMGNPYRARK
jgi:hypothetical protein